MRQMRLLTYPDLREQFGLPYTREHVRRLVKQGSFPKPRIRLSSRFHAWDEADVQSWINSKRAA
jgi:prophage regulatory protein